MPTAIAARDILSVELNWIDPSTGVRWISTPMADPADYEVYRTLPELVRFEGQIFALTGWNSDMARAYYRDRLPVARRV